MRSLLLIFALIAAHSVAGQTVVDPRLFPVQANPDNTNFEFYSRKNGSNVKASFDAVKIRMMPLVRQPNEIAYTPSGTGNSNDKGHFVRTAGGATFYIDGLGNALQLNPIAVTAGDGITITGTPPDITISAADTDPTNELQTLSAAGSGPFSVALSDGGGAVAFVEGTGIDIARSGDILTLSTTNTGTVTSVGISAPPSEFNVSGSPVTGSGTLALTWDNQTVSKVLAAPSGGSGQPSFRRLGTTELTGFAEAVLDTVAAGLVAWSGIDATYNDATGKLILEAVDTSATNELQTLSLVGLNLTLSNGGGTVALSVLQDNWGTQGAETDATLAGNGTTGSPLKIAQQSATSGQVLKWNGTTWAPASDSDGGGTVTSVGLSLPTSVFDVSGSPVTGSGTLTATLDNQSANTVFSGPTSGGAATPGFRALVAADIPTLTASKISDFTEASQDAVFPAVVAGSNITVSYNDGANTLTITGSAGPTNAFVQNGNSFGAQATLGTNDPNDLAFETNNSPVGFFNNGGGFTSGATANTSARIVANGLLGGSGVAVVGGSGLTGGQFFQARGDGSGTTMYDLDGVHNNISGNVLVRTENSSTTGSGGAYLVAVVNGGSTGDAATQYSDGAATWTGGIDNSLNHFQISPNALLGNVATGVTIETNGFVGLGTLAARSELEVFGTGSIIPPIGSTAQRLVVSAPQIRYNNTRGGFEGYDFAKGVWRAWTATAAPTVTPGAAAGTGGTAVLTAGRSSNDLAGCVTLTVGTSPAVGTLFTVTYSTALDGTTSFANVYGENDAARIDQNKYNSQSTGNASFTVRAVQALTAGATYIIRYQVYEY